MSPTAQEVLNWIYKAMAVTAVGVVIYFIKDLLDEIRTMRKAIEGMTTALGKLGAEHGQTSRRVDRLEGLWDELMQERRNAS